jgi:Domain of unknown function (DUF4136)
MDQQATARISMGDHDGRRLRRDLVRLVVAAGVCIAVQLGHAAVKARVEYDRMFDFGGPRTWSWNPNGAGQIMLARTPDDDPETVRQRAEPIILDAVNIEMGRRGLKVAAGMPDLTVTYYLLLTIGTSGQTLGQFLPSVSQWGVPPFVPSTTSLSVIPQGSLVLDVSANGRPVWRGIGEAEIKWDLAPEKRAELLREAVRELLRRLPRKS